MECDRHSFRSLRRLTLVGALLCAFLLAKAQAPAGYYDGAKGKCGKELKTALFQKITAHTQRSYSQLWTDFAKTDVRPDGTIWDMYSNATSYSPTLDHGKDYKKEGDCFNREHSFPKSWFGGDESDPMYTDLFHLYPTDGYVNYRRGNVPFGETEGKTYKSAGNFSKMGQSTVQGYTGVVFEPADEYKGDFARSYFYVVTAYEDDVPSWECEMLAGNSYPAFSDWALPMLLRWAADDPVSQKEIDRNNAVYGIQHNRNPYIDFPGLEQYVWGEKTTTAFDPDTYTASVQNVSATVKPTNSSQNVYSISGRCVHRRNSTAVTTDGTLPQGVYVVDGKKVMVK